MKYNYCILAAGAGQRNYFSKNSHKGLLPINNRAILSLIIEKLDPERKIVVAIGHNGALLRQYISIAHPEREIVFVEVDKIDSPGAGPGYSLLKCKPQLNCPFVLLNCDSYLNQIIPPPNKNWMGVSKVLQPDQYCLLACNKEKVESILDKLNRRSASFIIGMSYGRIST